MKQIYQITLFKTGDAYQWQVDDDVDRNDIQGLIYLSNLGARIVEDCNARLEKKLAERDADKVD